jgi:putative ABC transport system substrate-binding protein
MRRREFIALLWGATVSWPPPSHAQRPPKIHRIGYLGAGAKSVLPAGLDAFRQQLRQLGYDEGRNILIEYRWGGEQDDRLIGLARELVNLPVEVIVVEGHTPAITAAKRATDSIPIIMAVSGDPVHTGLVASLARPGGNVTGLTILTPDLAAKRLEILNEVLPKLGRVAVLWNAANPVKLLDWQETQSAARKMGLELQSIEVRNSADIDAVLHKPRMDRADALVVFSDGLINAHRKNIVDFAVSNRLPGMYPYREFVIEGGLISYAPSYTDLFRRAAIYVDKVLQGASPANLPVEQPTKFELIINLKVAKALDLTVPPSLLARADEVIE